MVTSVCIATPDVAAPKLAELQHNGSAIVRYLDKAKAIKQKQTLFEPDLISAEGYATRGVVEANNSVLVSVGEDKSRIYWLGTDDYGLLWKG